MRWYRGWSRNVSTAFGCEFSLSVWVLADEVQHLIAPWLESSRWQHRAMTRWSQCAMTHIVPWLTLCHDSRPDTPLHHPDEIRRLMMISDAALCHDSFARVPWLIRTCATTHSHVCHDSFAMTHSYAWHDSFSRVMLWNMKSDASLCHDSFIRERYRAHQRDLLLCVPCSFVCKRQIYCLATNDVGAVSDIYSAHKRDLPPCVIDKCPWTRFCHEFWALHFHMSFLAYLSIFCLSSSPKLRPRLLLVAVFPQTFSRFLISFFSRFVCPYFPPFLPPMLRPRLLLGAAFSWIFLASVLIICFFLGLVLTILFIFGRFAQYRVAKMHGVP